MIIKITITITVIIESKYLKLITNDFVLTNNVCEHFTIETSFPIQLTQNFIEILHILCSIL